MFLTYIIHSSYAYTMPLIHSLFFFLMIRRPPRSTQSRSSAASDVYKRQVATTYSVPPLTGCPMRGPPSPEVTGAFCRVPSTSVSYTHLRAHETVLDLVCRLLLEKKN
eukprot:TRINITY_DN2195_c0_g1_i2.p1 TRINITY_DN2195_c0_g1~~TRINITY_DN2195_c0_g1_i2.p1  ORF type:complete len:108 (+),score=49.92 TRINITY_DN2195_c0_g1_i2:30-353(+)